MRGTVCHVEQTVYARMPVKIVCTLVYVLHTYARAHDLDRHAVLELACMWVSVCGGGFVFVNVHMVHV